MGANKSRTNHNNVPNFMDATSKVNSMASEIAHEEYDSHFHNQEYREAANLAAKNPKYFGQAHVLKAAVKLVSKNILNDASIDELKETYGMTNDHIQAGAKDACIRATLDEDYIMGRTIIEKHKLGKEFTKFVNGREANSGDGHNARVLERFLRDEL